MSAAEPETVADLFPSVEELIDHLLAQGLEVRIGHLASLLVGGKGVYHAEAWLRYSATRPKVGGMGPSVQAALWHTTVAAHTILGIIMPPEAQP